MKLIYFRLEVWFRFECGVFNLSRHYSKTDGQILSEVK